MRVRVGQPQDVGLSKKSTQRPARVLEMSSVEQLSQLLLQIQSGDNAVRAPAEARLYSEWIDAGGDRPAQLLVGLAQLSAEGPDPAQRANAAVILRRCATRVSFDSQHLLRVIDQVSAEARTRVRELVLQGMLAADQPSFTRHKLGDAVAELARRSAAGPEVTAWPGLLEAVAGAARTSSDANVRETAFRVLSAAPELLEEREDIMGAAIELLMHGFEDPSGAVRTTAVVAFSAFFVYLPRRTWALLKPLLPALLNVMEPLRQARSEYELTSVLESLVTLVGLAPRMFSPVFGTLVEFALAIAGDTEFDEGARMTALELMAAFAEEAPNMCRREPKYAAQLVPLLLKMLTEIGADDEDGSEWNNTDDSEQVEEDEPVHREAKLAIDRLSLSLGGDIVTPLLFEYLPLMMQSASWRDRAAALMALSNAAEGCRTEMLPQLEGILRAVEPLLRDEHPRVQWSACNALGQLSTDLAPEVQESYGSLILPGLIEKLNSVYVFKVQAHAAAALVNFSDAANQEAMNPFLDDLLTRLLGLVQSPKRYVQEQALTTIAMVADSAQELFIKYYDTLMPLVMDILVAQVPVEYRLLKAKAIECSTLIALAVGREKFLPQLPRLGEILVGIQKESPEGVIRTAQGEEEDPCHSYLVQSWGRLCRVVGKDFLPYLPVVMPPLLAAAKSQADCHILDVEQAENLRDAEGWEVVKYSGQWLGVHTAVFEEKASAIELLHVYPRELGGAFWPWAPEILAEVVTPGIKFYYNLRVRAFSCQLVPHLVACAQQHFQALQAESQSTAQGSGQVAGALANSAGQAEVLAIWQPLLTVLLNGVLRNERETPAMFAEAFLTIYRCVELIGPAALSESDIAQLCSCLIEATASAKFRIESRLTPPSGSGAAPGESAAEDEEDEDEDDDEIDDEEQEDEELLDASTRLVHALLRTYGFEALLATPFAQLIELVPLFCVSPASDAQLWALEAAADLAEFGKGRAAPVLQQLGIAEYAMAALSASSHGALVAAAPTTARAASSAAATHPAVNTGAFANQALPPLIRAAAALCVGRLALFGGASCAAQVVQSLEPLFALALAADARADENIDVCERSCGAIARILRTHGPSGLSAEQFALAVGQWLKTLPIIAQADGAAFSYLFLAELIEKKHAVVLESFDTAFSAVVKALVARTLAGKPAEFVIAQVKPLLASLPESQQLQLFNQLNNAEQQLVRAVFA